MSLLTAPVSASAKRAAPAQAAPAIPFVLQSVIEDIETKLVQEARQAKQVLTLLLARLHGTLDALDEEDVGHIRPIKDVKHKIRIVSVALENLNEEAMIEKRKQETAEYIIRFKELEQREREKKQKSDELVKKSETRFLPMAPAGGSSGVGALLPKAKNHDALMAKELRYKFGMEQRPVEIIHFDMCPKCMVAMQYNMPMQQLECPVPSCRHWKRFADMTSAALAYGEDIEFCKYAYNPVTHLDDKIKFAEAGEAYVVPPEHLEMVLRQLYIRGVKPEDMTIPIVRSIIYDIPEIKTENTVQVFSRLSGRSPRRLDSFARDQMRIMFITQAPYYRKYANGRTNMLSYPYVLYKYCELLGYWEMLETMSLLRGPSNLSLHDSIQQKISRDLEWEFIPTVKDL